jgi:hypothetical protein
VSGPHPSAAHRDGTAVHPGDPELLESLERADDVHQRIDRAHLVQRHCLRRKPVHLPLGFTQQPDRGNRPVPHPGRERGPFQHCQQLPDVAMRHVTVGMTKLVAGNVTGMGVRGGMARGVGVGVIVQRNAGLLLLPAGQDHVYLEGADAAPIDGVGLNPDVGKAQAGRQALQPLQWSPGRDQRAQQHVTADPRGWVQYGKTSIRHRLINMAGFYPDGKPPGSR